MRNLAVGHFYNEPFIEACKPWTERIREVFFAWPGVLSCRPAPVFDDAVRQRLFDDLAWCRANGILLDTLFNCNCYGEQAVSMELAEFVCRTLRDMDGRGVLPEIVTTTSPFIATVLRREFPQIHLRASVNLRAHGTVGFETVADIFDSFYLSREHQRDLGFVKQCSEWARANGKLIGMQVNSGCLRQCAYQTFHDNLHGHGDGRTETNQAAAKEYGFNFFLCKKSYGEGKFEEIIRGTWIRPEDVQHFENYVDVFKIATRRIANPTMILNAYASGSFEGNLLDLLDPVHSALFAPRILDNKLFPKDFATCGIGGECANNCRHCGKCTEMLARVLK